MATSYGDVYLRMEDAKTVLPGEWLADQVSGGRFCREIILEMKFMVSKLSAIDRRVSESLALCALIKKSEKASVIPV